MRRPPVTHDDPPTFCQAVNRMTRSGLQMEIKLRDVLRREMKSRNESVLQIAKGCKIPRTTLNDWVQGVLPSAKNIHHLKSLAEYLNTSVTMLLFNVKDENADTSILCSSTFVDQDRRYRIIIKKLPK